MNKNMGPYMPILLNTDDNQFIIYIAILNYQRLNIGINTRKQETHTSPRHSGLTHFLYRLII